MEEKKACVVFHQGKLEEEREKATEKKRRKKRKKETKREGRIIQWQRLDCI